MKTISFKAGDEIHVSEIGAIIVNEIFYNEPELTGRLTHNGYMYRKQKNGTWFCVTTTSNLLDKKLMIAFDNCLVQCQQRL